MAGEGAHYECKRQGLPRLQSMKKVLLTGASGFVGRHCLPGLTARGFEVHAVSKTRRVKTSTPAEVHWHHADLLDKPQVCDLFSRVQPTHFLHCAWYAVPGEYWSASENFRWVEAGLQLLRAFAANGGERVLGVGTCAEYRWPAGRCSEASTPLDPATTYGVCKHAFQILLNEFGKQAGLSTAWGRLFFLYGPNEYSDRLVASMIRSILQEKSAFCSHSEHIRDFLYIQDAADALVALLDSDISGAVNVASGIPISLRDLVWAIGTQLERIDLVQLESRPMGGSDAPLVVADVTRLRDEVGWVPKYDLQHGLAETIAWWKLQLES